MRWPFVHRARLEAVEYIAQGLEKSLYREAKTVERLTDELLRMKLQGFVAIPPKRAVPKPEYGDDPLPPDPFIEQQKREGVPEHLARQAQQEAIDAFESGEA